MVLFLVMSKAQKLLSIQSDALVRAINKDHTSPHEAKTQIKEALGDIQALTRAKGTPIDFLHTAVNRELQPVEREAGSFVEALARYPNSKTALTELGVLDEDYQRREIIRFVNDFETRKDEVKNEEFQESLTSFLDELSDDNKIKLLASTLSIFAKKDDFAPIIKKLAQDNDIVIDTLQKRAVLGDLLSERVPNSAKGVLSIDNLSEKDLASLLFDKAGQDDLASVVVILDRGVDPNKTSEKTFFNSALANPGKHYTFPKIPIVSAALRDKQKMVEFLEKLSDKDRRYEVVDFDQQTSLMTATEIALKIEELRQAEFAALKPK